MEIEGIRGESWVQVADDADRVCQGSLRTAIRVLRRRPWSSVDVTAAPGALGDRLGRTTSFLSRNEG